MQVRILTVAALIVAMAAGVMLGMYFFWYVRSMLPAPPGAALPLAFRMVRDSYVEPIDEEALVKRAILGLLQDLDSHSAYLEPNEVAVIREENAGQFGGIGVEIGFVDGQITVVAPIDGTPAAAAGLQAGDAIIEVDGRSLQGHSVRDAMAYLRGEPGTDLTLRISRPGEPAPWDVELVREVIPIRTVRSRLLEPGYGYLRITEFQRKTPADVLTALDKLADEAGTALEGLVIDLRGNPGGILGSAVDVADAFLDGGLITYTEGRDPTAEARFEASGEDSLAGAPLAVLINGRAASAAEIVAGALQHHGRAVLLGTPSYGKASVQLVLSIARHRALRLTTAHYYTPAGQSISAAGIQPDVLVPMADDVTQDAYDEMLLATALRELKLRPE